MQNIETLRCVKHIQDMRIEHEFTESEVADAVSTLKLRKAPGIDGIQAEHLK